MDLSEPFGKSIKMNILFGYLIVVFKSAKDEQSCLEYGLTHHEVPHDRFAESRNLYLIIIIIIIIAFKGAIRDFLQSPHSAANCLQHVCSSGPGANHVLLHIERLSRASVMLRAT